MLEELKNKLSINLNLFLRSSFINFTEEDGDNFYLAATKSELNFRKVYIEKALSHMLHFNPTIQGNELPIIKNSGLNLNLVKEAYKEIVDKKTKAFYLDKEKLRVLLASEGDCQDAIDIIRRKCSVEYAQTLLERRAQLIYNLD